jgi:hypothetical protein
MRFINTTQHIEIEKFEDIKGVILTVKSRKDRQYNGQKKNAKRTNNYLQTLHRKLKIVQRLKPEMNYTKTRKRTTV